MLFNSYPFILLFLPVTLLGYVLIGKKLGRGAGFGARRGRDWGSPEV